MSAISTPPLDTFHVPASSSKAAIRAGWALTGFASLFLVMDGAMKLALPAPVAEAFRKLDLPLATATPLGALLLACTALYLVPRTAALGAVLLTGFLGGAVATHVRASGSAFEDLFPVIVGALVWGGLLLRDERLRALLPLRKTL